MNPLLALGARGVTIGVSLVCGLLTTRLILGTTGVEYYSLFTLLVALPTVFSFTDLGSGAAVVNAVASSSSPRTDETVFRRTLSVTRIQLGFAAALLLANVIAYVTGFWAVVLGEAGGLPGATTAAFCCFAVFCVQIPMTIWIRILLGLGKNHVIILLQGLQSPITLLVVWLALQAGPAWSPWLASGSYLAAFIVAVLGLSITTRSTRPLVGRVAGAALVPWREPGLRVMDIGWPVLVQLLANPIAVSSQRYIVAQSGTQHDVAEYGVAGQVFFAIGTLVSAAGVALWPVYTRRRMAGELNTTPFAMSGVFTLAAALASGIVIVFSPFIFGLITDGEVAISLPTLLGFAAMISLQAAIYPLGMFLMTKAGVRFQVIPTALMAISTVALAVVITPTMGAAGPLWANSAAMLVFQLIPFMYFIRRNRSSLMAAVE